MFIKLIVFGTVIFGAAVLQTVFDRVFLKIDFSTVPAWKLIASRVTTLLCGGAIATTGGWAFFS